MRPGWNAAALIAAVVFASLVAGSRPVAAAVCDDDFVARNPLLREHCSEDAARRREIGERERALDARERALAGREAAVREREETLSRLLDAIAPAAGPAPAGVGAGIRPGRGRPGAGGLIGTPSGVGGARALTPARVFLRAAQIPPAGVGAYGVVSFRAKATASTRSRFLRVCEAFKAYLPRQSDLPASVAISDQMLTVWPLEAPSAREAVADDCRFLVDRYDLFGGQSAIADAARQGGAVTGDGPFLIGWSPSNTRGVRDKLVLVVDLSGLDSQESINQAFHFWQMKVVQDPELWRRGFSAERLRLSIRDFVDRYGSEMLAAVKLAGLGGQP